MIRMLITSWVVLVLTSTVGGQVIRISDRVEVESEKIVLGDIAEIRPAAPELAHIPLGYAPYPGHYRWVTKPDVEYHLRKWGLEEGVEIRMPSRVLITRDSQQVGVEEIHSRVREFLISSYPEFEISLHEVVLPQEIFLPRGPVEIVVDCPERKTRLKAMNLKLDFYVCGRRIKSQWAKVSAIAKGPVLVLKRDVPYGRTLRESDLCVEVREVEQIEEFFRSPEHVIGTVSKRNLQEGEILTKRDLKQAELVKRGEVVKLLAHGEGFAISALGRARDSGSRGDSVRVENLDSREVIQATVIDKNTVEVLLPGGI